MEMIVISSILAFFGILQFSVFAFLALHCHVCYKNIVSLIGFISMLIIFIIGSLKIIEVWFNFAIKYL